MITRFTARGFRNLDVIDLPLGPVNVLVGPNNCGKTNLLRALTRRCELFEVRERERGRPLGKVVGWDDLARSLTDGQAELAWCIELPEPSGDTVTYALALEKRNPTDPGMGVQVVHETVVQRGSQFAELQAHRVEPGIATFSGDFRSDAPVRVTEDAVRHEVAFNGGAWPFTQGNQTHRDAAERLERTLRNAFHGHLAYHAAEFALADIRHPASRADLVLRLDPKAGALVNALRDEEGRAGDLAWYTRRLQDLLPELERVWTRDAGQVRWVTLQIGGEKVALGEQSDGTLQAFVIAWLLDNPEPGLGTLAIDEPELHLHPAWLRVMGRWLQTPAHDRQMVISTHSADLLDTFTEGFSRGEVQVIVFDEPGRPVVLDAARIRRHLDEGWELGDLYRIGDPDFGGWPH